MIKPNENWMEKTDWERPSLSLLVYLGSIIVHADEFLGKTGHPQDYEEFKSGMDDPVVKSWLAEGTKRGFFPIKR